MLHPSTLPLACLYPKYTDPGPLAKGRFMVPQNSIFLPLQKIFQGYLYTDPLIGSVPFCLKTGYIGNRLMTASQSGPKAFQPVYCFRRRAMFLDITASMSAHFRQSVLIAQHLAYSFSQLFRRIRRNYRPAP